MASLGAMRCKQLQKRNFHWDALFVVPSHGQGIHLVPTLMRLWRPALPNSVTFHHSNSTNWMLTSARRSNKSIAHLIPSHGHWSLVSGECVLQVRAFVPTLKLLLVHRCSLKVRKDYVATTRCDEQERGFWRFWNTFSSQDPGIKHACLPFTF